jgi:hypothetical protein
MAYLEAQRSLLLLEQLPSPLRGHTLSSHEISSHVELLDLRLASSLFTLGRARLPSHAEGSSIDHQDRSVNGYRGLHQSRRRESSQNNR